MGGWAGTCANCKHRVVKKVNKTRTAHYCEKHEKFMLGRFPPSYSYTVEVCHEPKKEV